MAQCRSNTRVKEALTAGTDDVGEKDDAAALDRGGPRSTSKKSPSGLLKRAKRSTLVAEPNTSKSTFKRKTNVETKRVPPSIHSIMKTKQTKEELNRSVDEELVPETSAKTRGRKKAATEAAEEDKKGTPDTDSKVSKKTVRSKISKTVVRKRPLGIQKTLRSKKVVVVKDKLKNVIKQKAKRGRKPAIKVEPGAEDTQEKEIVPLIPAAEIKKEPLEEPSPSSRSSSPKTAGRRQRVTSDMAMMKSVLGDSPSTLVLGPRTSPYSMRSERSNSPSTVENKNRRSGRPRKLKNNLLNEVVMNEQKKRRRLLSDSKAGEGTEAGDEGKKPKRGRSCSRDGSEFSKCSDVSESDVSLTEAIGADADKELEKKSDKTKTDLDVDNELNLQISNDSEKVPSLDVEDKIAELKPEPEPSAPAPEKTKRKLSLKRSTSLDSDNNNSNRLKLDNIHNSSDVDDKSNISFKTENDTLFTDRSSILTSMSKTFNSKEVSKNIRKARRGRRAATARPATQTPIKDSEPCSTVDGKDDTLESISKEINDLIQTLEVSDVEPISEDPTENTTKADTSAQTKSVAKFYNLPEVKPLTDNNSLTSLLDTSLKEKDVSAPIESSTSLMNDDSENIRLHFEGDEDSPDKSATTKEITYKCTPIASIDKLMDRLKTFEEFDKKRQNELMKTTHDTSKPVMVTSDVVLIPKSGADVKPLKDIQTVRSPERHIEKENVLSCFENNSAISIVKRDQVRKSLDVELPNSVTLIKRNSVTARKESTGSNHSRESTDAISIFEKSLGKDVTLTEIRKSVDKSTPTTPVELHQFATLLPNNPVTNSRTISLASNEISITPRVSSDQSKQTNSSDIQLKRHSRDSLPKKSSEPVTDLEPEKMATIERIKSPVPISNHQIKPPVSITSFQPIAVKSPEVVQPMETEVLAPPLDSVKAIPENIALTSEIATSDIKEAQPLLTKSPDTLPNGEELVTVNYLQTPLTVVVHETEQAVKDEITVKNDTVVKDDTSLNQIETKVESADLKPKDNNKKPLKSPVKGAKPKRAPSESQPGPSNMFAESPECQKKKENVLRTLGLLTHKAAKEARIEKQKEKERIYAKTYGSGLVNKNKTAKTTTTSDYTGTLKTVIKLNRSSGEREKGKKYRSSLKMTFQKSKHRTGKPLPDVEAASADDTYYTIERREGAAGSGLVDGGHRKSHYSNRLNYDTTTQESAAEQSVEPGKEATLNLVIPEKASSFSIHPGRLCMDQCFYCGGKFGLFDTPCHIAQMKSSERQKKVLDNEEKLTIDSCLCDACYRHVDRRANCPSYRRNKPAARPLPPPVTEKSTSPTLEEESDEEQGVQVTEADGRPAHCHTAGCIALADHTIPRKWLIKMRPSVNKLLKLELDYPGLHTIPLCAEHHRALAPLMACVLCQRRITKHHKVHTISQNYEELNPLLSEAGIPVQFTERPVLCNRCRYYCSLLQRPTHNVKSAKAYRRRLLQVHNIEVPHESESETDQYTIQLSDDSFNSSKQKKKARTKSKQRRSTEPNQNEDGSHERTSESSPDKAQKDESNDSTQKPQNMEEDIESLISSNKILVPGVSKPSSAEPSLQSDNSDAETLVDYDSPLIPLDKQTELQYLLQKQNNPAQFLHKPTANLTQKSKSMLKAHSPIQKPGHHHRIHDKNAKRIQKLGQVVIHKEKQRQEDKEIMEVDKPKDVGQGGVSLLKNLSLNEECTIESVPNRKPADINTLKNKWEMSESFTQVKRNLSELSKNLTGEKPPKKVSDTRYSNPVKRLETNPSISVRELFPGEEEMNLQCNIEFSNVRGVTPQGWEKCNSTIQYDVETKKLWNELQRPYGNQSSFLRHLVLLEKYFRNGDLVLANNATASAANYSDSVQSRLRAYDNVANDAPRRSEPAISLIEYRKKPTIPSASANGKSLLKSNQLANDPEKSKSSATSKKPFLTPTIFPKPKSAKSDSKTKSKPLPPELIAINTPNAQGRKAIQNVLHNIQQLVKGVSAADPTEVAAAPLPHQAPKMEQPKKQKTTKPWRPTLMPITQENLSRIAREPLQLAVDGRSLPSLVQVMSSGNRYHITIQDYNKMCVMRREKLQQLHDGDTKRRDDTTMITEIQPSAMLGNGGTVKQTLIAPDRTEADKPKDLDLAQITTNAATILKNVGLKNITIAPISAKTATVTSHSLYTPSAPPPSLLIAGAPMKIPQLGPAVSITSETIIAPPLPVVTSGPIQITGSMVLPKIPKSLTVIPQMMPAVPTAPTTTSDKTQTVAQISTQVSAATEARP